MEVTMHRRLAIVMLMALVLSGCKFGLYTGSDAQMTAIALGKTQGAPDAARDAIATYQAAQGTPTPDAGWLPDFEGQFDEFGSMISPTPDITPTPMLQMARVTTKFEVEQKKKGGEVITVLWHWFKSQPGEVASEFFPGQLEGAKGAGQIRSGVTLPIFMTASVDHYFGIRITGWAEELDVDRAANIIACIPHEWDHTGKILCHAHIFADPAAKTSDTILGVLMPGVGIRILEERPDLKMVKIEVTSLMWLGLDQVQDFTHVSPPVDCTENNCTFIPFLGK